jgi:SAM-dependent methyltransferase
MPEKHPDDPPAEHGLDGPRSFAVASRIDRPERNPHMTPFLNGVARAMITAFAPKGPVLEVGSYQVEGQGDLIELRGQFPNEQQYVGLDIRPGPGVDRVGSVEKLPFPDASFGCVLAFNTFEHVQRFWVGFEEVFRVLKPDGVLLMSVPFHFRIHHHPSDYWRFTPEALDVLLERYAMRLVGWHGPDKRPANVWAAAFRERAAMPNDAQLATYRQVLTDHVAGMPAKSLQKLRYQFGKLLFGKRPFANYLDQYHWGSRLSQAA